MTKKRPRRSQSSKPESEYVLEISDDLLPRPKQQSSVASSTVDPILLTLAKEQLKTLPKFAGAPQDDVLHWLLRTEEIFDAIQLSSSAKFIAVQSYLSDAALQWFRFNKSDITDWSTFKNRLTIAYQPTIQEALAKLEHRSQSSDEPVMTYHFDKLNLCHQVDPKMSTSLIIHYLLKGLQPHLIPHVMRRQPESIDDFLEYAQDEEKIVTTLRSLSLAPSASANAYSHSTSDDIPIIGAIKPTIRPNRPVLPGPSSSPRSLMSLDTMPPSSSSTSRFPSRPSQPFIDSRQCYVCYGFGHIAAQCPSRKNI